MGKAHAAAAEVGVQWRRRTRRTHPAARAYINAGYSIIISYHMVTMGSERENRLFAATVTTGAMAAMAVASFGFYTHDAVARLLLRSSNNNAGNARVEGRLSKMEQSMQQQQERETSVLNQMSASLDMTNAKLGHLDKPTRRWSAHARASPPRRREGARPGSRRGRRARCVYYLVVKLHHHHHKSDDYYDDGEGATGSEAPVVVVVVGAWRWWWALGCGMAHAGGRRATHTHPTL